MVSAKNADSSTRYLISSTPASIRINDGNPSHRNEVGTLRTKTDCLFMAVGSLKNSLSYLEYIFK